MMVSMETYLLRVKRRTERWSEHPALRVLGEGVLSFAGGFLLSPLRLWGQMQPAAMGLILGTRGWRACCAALGSAMGYRYFWPTQWVQGAVWSAGAMALSLLLPLMEDKLQLPFRLAIGAACLTAGAELAIQTEISPDLFALRLAIAGLSGLIGEAVVTGRNRMFKWTGWGLLTAAVTGIHPLAGLALSGLAASAFPIPAAMLTALGASLGSGGGFPVLECVCLSFFLRRVPVLRDYSRKLLAPGAACLVWMLLFRNGQLPEAIAIAAGGAAGALLPWQVMSLPRRSITAAVQVRLEQLVRILLRFQRQLLEYAPPPADEAALASQLRDRTCAACPARHHCQEQARMNTELLHDGAEFVCRKSDAVRPELRRSRDQLRRMKLNRAMQSEYRMALVQQYGFLADILQRIADHLPEREPDTARFRIQVSARSRGREIADGDRVTAFPGLACRFYVLLCDGMGTGLGASEESRQASALIRQMLTAGLPPEAVMGSMNSQLALTQRGGAVTVDLAEIRLNSGRALLYKWGAGPSWLLRKRKGTAIGISGPPPGLGVTLGRESISRASLASGETLVMVSDGVSSEKTSHWAANATTLEPGELAKQILQDSSPEDDATAVVIRLKALPR